MVQKKTPQRIVVGAFDHLAALLSDSGGLAAAGPVKCEPAPASFKPAAQLLVLLIVRIGTRDVRYQQPRVRQPSRQVAVVVAYGRIDRRVLFQDAEESQPGVVHVVSRRGPGRESAHNQMDARDLRSRHGRFLDDSTIAHRETKRYRRGTAIRAPAW